MGYDVSGRKLVINAEEAVRVRLIFEQYLALGCVSKLREDLEQQGIGSKERIMASGRVSFRAFRPQPNSVCVRDGLAG